MSSPIPYTKTLDEFSIEDLRRVYAKMDTDANGIVTKDELRRALNHTRYYMTGNRDLDVEMLFAETDANKDKGLSWQEFMQALRRPTNNWGAQRYTFQYFVTRFVARMHTDVGSIERLYQTNKSSKWYWPPRLFMVLISVIQIAVFLHYADEDCDMKPNLECPPSHSTDLAYRMCCRSEVWRFVTYCFVHVGWNHLLFNVVIQLIFGLFLEIVNGSLRVGLVYFAGALAGSLASSVCEPTANVVGASGAVYCMIGAWYAYVAINWDTLDSMKKWIGSIFLLVLTCADFGTAIHLRYVEGNNNGTSIAGHLGGLLMGATFGTYALRNVKMSRYERYIKWFAITVASTGVIFAVFFNIFNDPDEDFICPLLSKCST